MFAVLGTLLKTWKPTYFFLPTLQPWLLQACHANRHVKDKEAWFPLFSLLLTEKTRKAQLAQRGTCNSGTCLKAQSPEGARRPAA